MASLEVVLASASLSVVVLSMSQHVRQALGVGNEGSDQDGIWGGGGIVGGTMVGSGDGRGGGLQCLAVMYQGLGTVVCCASCGVLCNVVE